MGSEIQTCPGCQSPAHATETDDENYHPECRQADDRNLTARKMVRVMAPVGARCKLCKLNADPGDMGVFQLSVMYGGERHGEEGNELCPLWRRLWICEPCIKAITAASRKRNRP